MKRSFRAMLVITIVFTAFLSPTALAQKIELRYKALDQNFRYNNQVTVLNVTDTDKVHVSTQLSTAILLENKIANSSDHLALRVKFSDIKLTDYKREVQILNNEKRNVGPEDLKEMEAALRKDVKNEWVEVSFTPKGQLLSTIHSSNLMNVTIFNFARMVEQFLIPLPEDLIQVGYQWEDNHAPLALTTEEVVIGARIKYTYLGKESQNGVPCYKINASLALQEDRSRVKSGGGVTWISLTGHGTLYYAEDGEFLVKGNLTSDVSFLLVVEGKTDKFVNFMRTKIDQNIDLLK